jgi:hypothetical protein
LQIPNDTPNAMLYTSKNLRGLAITKAQWEAFLQHYNICMVLLRANDPYIPHARNIEEEMSQCEKALNFSAEEVATMEEEILKSKSKSKPKLTKLMRSNLQHREFSDWTKLKLRGIGVNQFEDNPKGNKSLMEKVGMTTSEYVTMIKMNANVMSLRAIPGRSVDGTQCRHCCAEKETLGHVLGSCQRGNLIRNQRHHGIRSILAKGFKENGYQVAEEVHCIATNGSTRRVDIIAYSDKKGYILDPTIRIENGDGDAQSNAVDLEKKDIYVPCIGYFKDVYKLDEIEVIGLYVGARGTISSFLKSFAVRFKLKSNTVNEIMLYALRGSIQIYNHHVST